MVCGFVPGDALTTVMSLVTHLYLLDCSDKLFGGTLVFVDHR